MEEVHLVDNSSGGDPFLAVTYTTDGASYSLANKTPIQQVTPTSERRDRDQGDQPGLDHLDAVQRL